MLKGFKIQLDPNKEQEILFNKHVGCCRFIYNQVLSVEKFYYNQFGRILPINLDGMIEIL